ncbi:MAG: nodulation protein NfeD [Muribaculaceae bacterium]|nr:nodulation protein NfeD [Muribaculaceae bacterium]
MKRLLLIFLAVIAAASLQLATAEKIVVLALEDEIDARAWQHTKRACEKAVNDNADLFVIRMNTYGGALDAADSIRTALLRLKVPTVAYVDHNAASAGALIALACDSVFMTPGSSIGAATVVDGEGKPMPDKYQAYMSAIMRSTAEHHGKWVAPGDTVMTWRRDPAIAEAMVNPEKVTAFSSSEAFKAGYSNGTVSSFDEMLRQLNISENQTEEFEPTLTDDIIGFLSNAGVRALLVMLIIGGIYMEMHTPGLGVAAAVALIAACLYFLPMLITGTLPAWIVITLVIGVVLIAFEVFVIPGFGICGIAGITAVVVALCAAIIPVSPEPDGKMTLTIFVKPLVVVSVGIVAAIGLVAWLTSRHGPKFFRRHSELMLTQDIKKGYIGVDMGPAKLVGLRATAMTDMRPAGKILIDGNVYDAVSTGIFIEASQHVRVVRYENAQLYVEPTQLTPH